MAAIFSNLRSKFARVVQLTFLLYSAGSAALEYRLEPELIAKNTYFLKGDLDTFTKQNGGAIANISFIHAEDRVLVVDSGPSKRFGDQLYRLISDVTGQSPTDLLITHHHPDHALGSQPFGDINIWALPKTIQALAEEGNGFAESLYLMIGDWMRGTEVTVPNKAAKPGYLYQDTERFELIPLTGHTGADLVLLDHQTRVLFASDVVFYQRALATPHTPGLKIWLSDIDLLETLDFEILVPGHGPVVSKPEALSQMRDYINWLDQLLWNAAENGLTMNEVIVSAIPERFSGISLTRYELTRTVAHLYPEYEKTVFQEK